MYFVLLIHPVVLDDQSVEDDLSNWECSHSVILVSLVLTFSSAPSPSLLHNLTFLLLLLALLLTIILPIFLLVHFLLILHLLLLLHRFLPLLLIIASPILLRHLLELVLCIRLLFIILLHNLVPS